MVLPDNGCGAVRTVANQAAQFAAVAAAMYDGGHRGSIRLPLEPAHPLANTLRHAMRRQLVRVSMPVASKSVFFASPLDAWLYPRLTNRRAERSIGTCAHADLHETQGSWPVSIIALLLVRLSYMRLADCVT